MTITIKRAGVVKEIVEALKPALTYGKNVLHGGAEQGAAWGAKAIGAHPDASVKELFTSPYRNLINAIKSKNIAGTAAPLGAAALNTLPAAGLGGLVVNGMRKNSQEIPVGSMGGSGPAVDARKVVGEQNKIMHNQFNDALPGQVKPESLIATSTPGAQATMGAGLTKTFEAKDKCLGAGAVAGFKGEEPRNEEPTEGGKPTSFGKKPEGLVSIPLKDAPKTEDPNEDPTAVTKLAYLQGVAYECNRRGLNFSTFVKIAQAVQPNRMEFASRPLAGEQSNQQVGVMPSVTTPSTAVLNFNAMQKALKPEDFIGDTGIPKTKGLGLLDRPNDWYREAWSSRLFHPLAEQPDLLNMRTQWYNNNKAMMQGSEENAVQQATTARELEAKNRNQQNFGTPGHPASMLYGYPNVYGNETNNSFMPQGYSQLATMPSLVMPNPSLPAGNQPAAQPVQQQTPVQSTATVQGTARPN